MHVAISTDGNRRWATQHGLQPAQGYDHAVPVFLATTLAAKQRRIEYISYHIFNTNNWKRNADELDTIMRCIKMIADEYTKCAYREQIGVRWVGEEKRLDQSVIDALQTAVAASHPRPAVTACLHFNYDCRQELVDAANRIIVKGMSITPDGIDQELRPGSPPVDLFIRPSGEYRTSGFDPWRMVSAEITFPIVGYPGFTSKHPDDALSEYRRRNRSYGGPGTGGSNGFPALK